MIIDITKKAFAKFPVSLNGKVLLEPDVSNGYHAASLADCYVMSKLTSQQRTANGWTKYETLLSALDFTSLTTANKLASTKKQRIIGLNSAYQSTEKTPVTYLNVSYSGGRSSAQSINESLMLSEMAGATTVDVYDKNNNPQSLSIADAKTLVLTIAQAAKLNLFNLMAKTKAANAATTQTQLDAVVW